MSILVMRFLRKKSQRRTLDRRLICLLHFPQLCGFESLAQLWGFHEVFLIVKENGRRVIHVFTEHVLEAETVHDQVSVLEAMYIVAHIKFPRS